MTIDEKIKELEKEFLQRCEDLRKEALKEEEFKVGDWYTFNEKAYEQLAKARELRGRCFKYLSSRPNISYPNEVVLQFEEREFSPNWMRKATPSEIETHLLAEAKKKGFVVGARVRSKKYPDSKPYVIERMFMGTKESCDKFLSLKEYPEDYGTKLIVTYANGKGYDRLESVELLPSTPHIEINGKPVKFEEDHIKVGCDYQIKIYDHQIKQLVEDIEAWNKEDNVADIVGIEFMKGDRVSVGFGDIKKIYDHFYSKKP